MCTQITFTFTATHGGDYGDVVTNTAAYSSTSALAASAIFNVYLPASDLVIHKVVTPVSTSPRQLITYTLTFSNGGDIAATGVVITDTIPSSVTDTSVVYSSVAITPVSGTRYVWDVENLEPDQEGVIVVAGILRPLLPSGTFTNTVTIGTVTVETNPANNGDSAGVTVWARYVFLPLACRDWP